MDNKIWLESYSPGVPAEIDLAEIGSIADYLEQAVARYADRPAFISGATGVAISYRELDRLSLQVAGYFQSVLKLPAGARVALMMPNLLQYPVCLFGLLRAGYVVVNVNPMYTPRELEHQLKDSGAEAMIVVELFAHTLAKVIAATQVRHVVVTGLADALPWAKRTLGNFAVRHLKKMVPAYNLPGHVGYLDMLSQGAAAGFKPVATRPGDLAFLQYTGGTTGVSKGAMLTHLNVLANAKQGEVWSAPFLDPNEALISITAIPLYHVFALGACLGFVGMGGANVLVADPRNVPAFVRVLSQYRFASIPAVNTLFNGLIHDPGFARLDFSALRFAIGGGAAVQRAVAQRWEQITGKPLVEGYGLTECSPTVTCNPLDLKAFNGSIGLPMPSTEVSIRDDQGRELPFGQAGELCVRGPQVMQGYWQRPEETARVMTADGFLRTGDVAQMDEQGFLRIVDRLKDMILVSGFNVYPNEIEQVVMEHPEVLEVAAVGKPDPGTGEAVKLYIVKKTPSLTAEQVVAHCREQMTGYKVPRQIEFLDELPKSNVGKILRRELRERA
ncbi:AMP-binding protein [Roseateles toxinivorans]|uniref:Long-chain-fatty-acid--CoA ligase n=1 Tax=Roseateles toxinivorans TaxID=270368 RepID=A0A4R6QJA2_9BURK|nr:AMP-binding protein [Roseateles toxinivorans]TDP63474.1 long-chain acyl-CoA synthetase [Roseateles toxinivorans]